MRSGFVGVVCWSVFVGIQTIIAAPIAAPTDAPTDASTEAPTEAPTTAPPTPAPPTAAPPTPAPAPVIQVDIQLTLELKNGFKNVDVSTLTDVVKGQYPAGSKVAASIGYQVSVQYNFDATITESNMTTGIAALCSVNESQVSVTIGGAGGRLLNQAASPRRLSTSVDAVITSTTPGAAANVHSVAGNASGIANAMSVVTGQTIAQPTVTPPKASVAITTSVTAPTDGSTDITALKNIAQSSNLTTALATAANATVTVANVQVITTAPTAAPAVSPTPAPPTAAPAGSPTAAPAAPAGSTTVASNTTASTTAAKPPTNQETESFATMGWSSSTVAMAVMFELLAVVCA